MLTLLRVLSSVDWKARPVVEVVTLGRSESRDALVLLQDENILTGQRSDIEIDKEEEADAAESDDRSPIPHNGVWANKYRWEMERSKPEDLRTLAGRDGDGGSWSITFHILDL